MPATSEGDTPFPRRTELASDWAPPTIDTSRPHTARLYDYYLGGHDNFAADRELAEKVLRWYPGARTFALENRGFLVRAVHTVARLGVRQFLDIGTGIPTSPNTHEVAQQTAPESRIVYVDNDSMVLAHARALLTSHPTGGTTYLDRDLRDPDGIIASAREYLDLDKPVALMLVAVLHFVPDTWNPANIMRRLLADLHPDSYLVVSHVTHEHDPVAIGRSIQAYQTSGIAAQSRTADELDELLVQVGARPIDPGVVLVSEWGRSPENTNPLSPAEVSCYGAVCRLAR